MPLFPAELTDRAAALLANCWERRLTIVTAESCTGGLVAALLTEIPGSSRMVERGFVSYSNEAKQDLLGVSSQTLALHGAVSAETALAMAEGALKNSRAEVAVSVTGIAGPGGGSAQKPVGLVHFACVGPGARFEAVERQFGDLGRAEVRMAAIAQALTLLEKAVAGG